MGPPSKQLILLRHAKSSWDSGAKRDFDRPLNKRGQRVAPRMGAWLREKRLLPDYIVCSPAKRAKLTAAAVIGELGVPESAVLYDEALYLGDCKALLGVLSRCPTEAARVLVVGHNPGLEDLLLYLCGDVAPRTRDGKILVTAAVAVISMPQPWSNPQAGRCDLLELVRPKDLD